MQANYGTVLVLSSECLILIKKAIVFFS